MRRHALAALFITTTLALAGCASDPASSGPTASRAEDDLQTFLSALYDPDGRFAHVDAFSTMRTASEVLLPNATTGTMRSSFTRGAAGSTLDVNDAWGPIASIGVLCTPTASYLRVGTRDFETRWPPATPCGGGVVQNGPPRSAANYTFVNVSATETGGVAGSWTFEPAGSLVVRSASDGRIERVDLATDAARSVFTLEYGPRATLAPPASSVRLPADVVAAQQDDGRTLTWTIERADERPLLSELRLRFVDKARDATVADLVLRAGEQHVDGIVLAYADADGDERASVGDRATFAREDGGALDPLSVELFDTWAQRATRDREAMVQDALADAR